MGNPDDLEGFDGRCRLFPLPGLVFFPHTVLPLHIFEPRYVQMTEDAISSGDKLITMVQLGHPGTVGGLGDPPIEKVACLGRIIQHQRLPDGRFNLLLMGMKRVRLIREIPSDRLYRLAEASALEDIDNHGPNDPRRSALLTLFRQVMESRGPGSEPDLAPIFDAVLPLGVLTDLVVYALAIPPSIKQTFLADPHAGHRADRLLALLTDVLANDVTRANGHSRSFPPPFSVN